jgi:hypothetical protein
MPQRAEFVKEDPPEQQRDTVGLVAGVLFAAVGLTYLIGGNHVVSDHSQLLVPGLLVLLGLAGLAGSGLVRRPRRNTPAPEQAAAAAPVPEDVTPAPVPEDATPEA